MRRIRLTAFLLGTAAFAAMVAPRLLAFAPATPNAVVTPEAPAAPPVSPTISVVLETPAAPPQLVQRPLPRHRPAKAPPPPPRDRRTSAPELLIPELDEPHRAAPRATPHVPPAPPEVPDTFWENCPACGMG